MRFHLNLMIDARDKFIVILAQSASLLIPRKDVIKT